jgi:hypothetical protein
MFTADFILTPATVSANHIHKSCQYYIVSGLVVVCPSLDWKSSICRLLSDVTSSLTPDVQMVSDLTKREKQTFTAIFYV